MRFNILFYGALLCFPLEVANDTSRGRTGQDSFTTVIRHAV
jgi:hypothetical protein